jgi:DNA-binding SARP family transcriptional activator
VRLSLFGGFDVECNGVSVPLVLSAQRLMAFLALQSRQLPRVHVAGVLWTDVCETRASGNLRTVLWRLRDAGLDVVQTCNEHLKLAPIVAVDVHEAEAWARCILDRRSDCHDVPVADVPFRRELLPGWYDDWILIERDRQRQLGLHALEALADRLTACGRHEGAVLAGMAAVNAEPLRESAHRALIRAHLAEGNPTEAVRQYRVYADLLRRELDLQPSEALDALMRGLRTE